MLACAARRHWEKSASIGTPDLAVHDDGALGGLLGLRGRDRGLRGRRWRRHHGGPLQVAALGAALLRRQRLGLRGESAHTEISNVSLLLKVLPDRLTGT